MIKKVRIIWEGTLSPVNTVYENTGVKFSWLSAGKEKEVFSQITNWHTCRETFAGEICKFVGTTVPSKWGYKRQLNFEKTCIAVTRRHSKVSFAKSTINDLKWMKCSTRILNIFEKSQGWSLTRLSMCKDHNLTKNRINTFIFVGSNKWIQAPPLLSLYLLIIRLGRFWKDLSKFKKTDDLVEMAEILTEIKNSVYLPLNSVHTTEGFDDISWFIKTYKYWMPLLNNHNILFFNKSLETNYRNNAGFLGVNLLINGHGDKDLIDNWKKWYLNTKSLL